MSELINPQRLANAIRALSMDAVQAANSGHPGAPMGMADMAVALWNRHLKHNPLDASWPDRDRFVLSNGHASMLLYSLLHLTGYPLPISELQQFRQLHSKTPGHPEVDLTPGVETTTGPLGQGLANAVGMALAESLLGREFNRPGLPIVDHFTYVFMGDGCLMEGISHEVSSLAATWKLAKLIAFWDDNGISIDGEVRFWNAEDTVKRYEAYGWNVISQIDGHDIWAVDEAIALAKRWAIEGRPVQRNGVEERQFAPTFIQCKTVIGKGAPTRSGTAKAHGEPLGAEEIAATRAALDWDYPPFEIPGDVYAAWDAKVAGTAAQSLWQDLLVRYETAHPKDAGEFKRRVQGRLPALWDETVDAMLADALAKTESIASRKASQNALNHLGPAVPEMLGGSADLTGSNLTDFVGAGALRATDTGLSAGRHINYGVREFGMSAIMNGVALHGGFLPYGGTFLTFSDYCRNALRMAALMKRRVIQVFTHDSIGLGEDGPTHQSVEHAASLRLIPNLDVWRPADTVETAIAWAHSIERRDGPSALLLSRQNLPFVSRSSAQVDAIWRGAYVVREAGNPDAIIIATGSELGLALAARDTLAAQGLAIRIVSMPSSSVFDRQDVRYKDNLLPSGVIRVAVEAGVTDFWWKYRCDAVVGIDRYGESAPAGVLFKLFGFTAENVADTVREALRRRALNPALVTR
jgi:transketolase